MHVVTEYLHLATSKFIDKFEPATVIDMGGVGKLKKFLKCKIVDVNIKSGTDATSLSYKDDSFDVACSVATLEHVKDQKKFLEESIRVAKKGIVHWFPFGPHAERVEAFRNQFKHSHPCVVPSSKLIQSFEMQYALSIRPFLFCDSLLLLLATLYAEMKRNKVYNLATNLNGFPYGVFLYGAVKK